MHVGSVSSTAKAQRTPSASSSLRQVSPAASRPTRASRVTSAPAAASHDAELPPAPPGDQGHGRRGVGVPVDLARGAG